jgi:putative acetyltransferase
MIAMTIRAATIRDTGKIAVTHRASIEGLCSGCYNAQDIAGWVDIISPGIYESAINEKVMIVAAKGGEIIGLGILDPERQEVGAIYVHPECKGTGVGKRLLSALEAKALENNLDRLALCSTINAAGFYNHHGYILEGKTFHVLPNGVKLECIRM